jgi:hypothetical protein
VATGPRQRWSRSVRYDWDIDDASESECDEREPERDKLPLLGVDLGYLLLPRDRRNNCESLMYDVDEEGEEQPGAPSPIGPRHPPPWVHGLAALLGLTAPIVITLVFALPYMFVLQIGLEPYPSARPFRFVVIGTVLFWLVMIGLSFLTVGFEFGERWPKEGWRWGLWISVPGPIIFLAGRALFKSEDPWPPMLVIVVGAFLLATVPSCVGAAWGARRRMATRSSG